MTIVERAGKRAGIRFERDVPIAGSRRCRDWAKVIGTIRKLESEDGEVVELERQRNSDLSETVARLSLENAVLREELMRFRLKERMEEIDLPKQDQQRLLGNGSEVSEG